MRRPHGRRKQRHQLQLHGLALETVRLGCIPLLPSGLGPAMAVHALPATRLGKPQRACANPREPPVYAHPHNLGGSADLLFCMPTICHILSDLGSSDGGGRLPHGESHFLLVAQQRPRNDIHVGHEICGGIARACPRGVDFHKRDRSRVSHQVKAQFPRLRLTSAVSTGSRITSTA